MRRSPLAGKPATSAMLVDVAKLVTAYYAEVPDPALPSQRVAFGTSGHRGSAFECAFNEWHVLAISQAICDYRKRQGIDGPLFLGIDTHALSVPACASALEVLAANGVEVMLARNDEYTPTPVISHAILTYNRGRDGGPRGRYRHHAFAQSARRRWLQVQPAQRRAGRQRRHRAGSAAGPMRCWKPALRGVKRMTLRKALRAATTHRHDYLDAYVNDLGQVIDMEAIRGAGIRMGVDPLGGAGVHYWRSIAERYGLDLDRRQRRGRSDLPLHDGRLGRADPHGSVIAVCDAGPDRPQGPLRDCLCLRHRPRSARHRHRSAGLLPPNHYLAVAISYLFRNRPQWSAARGRGQDGGQQPDDRSRRGEARPQALRGAGRLQVVRRGPARRLPGLRRRRERRGILPASRRQCVDDGQGRHHPGIAVGGDHGAHGPRSRRTLPRARR